MARLLVLGDGRHRGGVAERLSAAAAMDVDDCDPALGDCVMFVRLEGARYAAFLFLGYDDPVTRGALAVVAERAVLAPLLAEAEPDGRRDGYLFRLPRALAFRDERERRRVHASFPQSAELPGELVGSELEDGAALARLVARAAGGDWAWAEFAGPAAGGEQDAE